jgi:hypothetical protein
MALATYDDLKSAILRWVARPDLANDVADFVSLFEAEARTKLNLSDQLTTTTITTVATNPLITIPTDAAAIVSLSVLNGPTLVKTTRDYINTTGIAGEFGLPQYYVDENATQLRLAPIPSSARDISLVYKRKFASLSVGSPTNWLLTDFPNLYLYGSLRHAKRFMQDDQWAEVENAYNTALADVKAFLANKRFGQMQTSWQAA